MNPHSAAVAGSGNPLKSRFESEIRAKIFAKSADPFAYSPPSVNNENLLQHHWLLKGTFSKKDRKSFFILAVNVCE